MFRLSTTLLPLLLLTFVTTAQQTAVTKDGKNVILNPDGTWKYEQASQDHGTLKVEAGLVYTDRTLPIARTDFILLDRDPGPTLKSMSVPNPLMGPQNGESAFLFREPADIPEVWEKVKPFIKYKLTTDFQGKATLLDIVPGTYWLYGRTTTRSGFGVWFMKLDIKTGEQSITIDQRNAGFIK